MISCNKEDYHPALSNENSLMHCLVLQYLDLMMDNVGTPLNSYFDNTWADYQQTSPTCQQGKRVQANMLFSEEPLLGAVPVTWAGEETVHIALRPFQPFKTKFKTRQIPNALSFHFAPNWYCSLYSHYIRKWTEIAF